jgi:hypothetical protein|nr:MAG TPA: virulence associated protein E [Caudoviricetes sp.]
MNIDLTIMASRTSKQWFPATITWEEFVEAAQEPATEKDCGAYMAGKATSTSRKDSRVEYRSMVTLDADNADAELPARVEGLGLTALVHSTYSHTTDKPRYRIIIPILGPGLTEEEYPRAAHGLMEALGKEQFDKTCDQPKRVMFWPSAASPDLYEVYSYKGETAAAQELLERFGGFSATPEHKRGPKCDPYKLPGVVGAFNRLYDMSRAVEEFNLPYEQVGENRWHYTNAKSSGGVCVYPDGYVYSNHASDPAGGRTLCMFDLVAMHKFNDLDEAADTPLNTAPKDRPSIQKALQEFTELPAVKKEMMSLNIESFGEGEDDWKSKLHVHPKTGQTLNDVHNLRLLKKHDPVLSGLAYNTMNLATITRRDFPWRKVTPGKDDQLTNADRVEISDHIHYTYNLRQTSKERVNDVIDTVAQDHSFHPVEEYLEGLEWDGVSRIETWLPGEVNNYKRSVARLTAVQSVARMLDPGVKVDNCMILSGGEGLGKTWFIERMARGWTCTLGPIDRGSARDTIMIMSRSWIAVADEGYSLKKADADNMKNFITRTHDEVRLPYARETVGLPRRQVIWGTTNDPTFLHAQEGNRRFLIVNVSEKLDFDKYTGEYVDQVWAEAVHLWKESRAKYGVEGNPDLYLNAEEEAVAKGVREEATEEDSLVGLIQDYLDTLVPENWETMPVSDRIYWLEASKQGLVKPGTHRIERVCSFEIWKVLLGNTCGKPSRVESLEIAEALRRVPGWESSGSKRARFAFFGRQRYFSRVEEAEPELVEEPVLPLVEESEPELAVVALDRATAAINAGRAADVKAALDKVGASRVSLLEGGQIQEFLDALPCEQDHSLLSDLL